MIQIPSSFVEQVVMQYAGYPVRVGGRINAGCPYCHEDSSWGKKRRFFYYPETTSCYCFNCGKTVSGYMFVKDQTGWEFREIARKVREDTGEGLVMGDVVYDGSYGGEVSEIPTHDLPPNSFDLMDSNIADYFEDDFYVKLALELISDRRLDTACNRPRSYYFSKDDFIHRNRLIIPFYNEQKLVTFYQSRALTKEQEKHGKYISKMDGEKTVCGIDRIDPDLEHLFVLEGPLDSFFIRNGLALTGLKPTPSQLLSLEPLRSFYQIIWCLDNHFENPDTRKNYERLIAEGEMVFLWDGKTRQKDFNDLCVSNKVDEVDINWILENTHQGRKAGRILATRLNG